MHSIVFVLLLVYTLLNSTMSLRPLIARIQATSAGGPVQRLVGSIDVSGKGTLHPLHDVDPIVLCDSGIIEGKGLPKFGMHPHYGVIACSVVIEGGLQDKDNLQASPGGQTTAGGIYCASAGRGICHEETTIADYNRILQVIVRIPPEKMALPPQIVKCKAPELPEVYPGVTLLVGELNGVKSPATPDSWPDAVFLRIKVPKESLLELSLPEKYPHGFCVVLDGSGSLSGQAISNNNEVLVFGKGNRLKITSRDNLDLFVAAGAPLLETPWVKKLGNNGFGIFRNEQEANTIMGEAVAAGNDWSYKVLDKE